MSVTGDKLAVEDWRQLAELAAHASTVTPFRADWFDAFAHLTAASAQIEEFLRMNVDKRRGTYVKDADDLELAATIKATAQRVALCFARAGEILDYGALPGPAPVGGWLGLLAKLNASANIPPRERHERFDSDNLKGIGWLMCDLGVDSGSIDRLTTSLSMLQYVKPAAGDDNVPAWIRRPESKAFVDTSPVNPLTDEMEGPLLKILPVIRASLIAAGYSEEKADQGISALTAAMLGPDRGAQPEPARTEAAQPRQDLTGKLAGGADLHAREERLWGLALGRGGALGDRANALATLSRLYRRAGAEIQRLANFPEGDRRTPGRPQQQTEEELFDIAMDQDVDLTTRSRALNTIYGRWQRLLRKARPGS